MLKMRAIKEFGAYVPWYIVPYDRREMHVRAIVHSPSRWSVCRPGVRLEKRMLKVLKAIAEQKDMSLGDLLEGIVLHAFEGKAPFSPQTLKDIEQFRTSMGSRCVRRTATSCGSGDEAGIAACSR